MKHVTRLSRELVGASPSDVLEAAAEAFPRRIAFATSLGVEDQAITHLIATLDIPIPVFTLDTGRMFEASYELLAATESRYGVRIRVFSPDAEELERLVNTHGVNLFRESVAARKLCCEVRKVGPLRRAQDGLDAWVCGLRRGQGVTRGDVDVVEWDASSGLVKFNPLAAWDEQQVWEFVRANDVPYNPLHDAGMPSIGCAPCTRAVQPGEDARAGRWWWESAEQRECGLHGRGGAASRAPESTSPDSGQARTEPTT